jgi:hypothetical protein
LAKGVTRPFPDAAQYASLVHYALSPLAPRRHDKPNKHRIPLQLYRDIRALV